MELPPELIAELHDLLWALRAGEADADQQARLEQLVREDVRARAFYVRYIHLCADLYWNTSEGLGENATPIQHSSLNTQHSPSAPISAPLASGPYFPADHLYIPSYIIATVICIIAAVAGHLYKIEPYTEYARSFGTPSQTTAVPPIPTTRDQAVRVARVTGMIDCHWSDPTTAVFNGAAVGEGRRLALASGLLQLSYDSGAKVILQGPCIYEVNSSTGGYLSLGKMTARVESKKWKVASDNLQISKSPNPKNSNPQTLNPNSPLATNHQPLFIVQTPTATITDLGTEFGVEVTDRGNTEACVFVGAVMIAAVGEWGETDAGHQIVLAGQTALLEGQSLAVKAAFSTAKNQQFVRAMPPSASFREADAYAALVRSLNPVVYYRMEQPQSTKDCAVLYDESGGGHHGVLTFSNTYFGRPYVAGRFGQSLRFRGPMVGDHVIVPDYPKATDDRLTVSAWVLCTARVEWPMIAANWGFFDPDGKYLSGQFHLCLFRNDGDLTAAITQRNGQSILMREGKAHPLPLGVWQHIALVVDESVALLYRNGIPVASEPVAGLLPHPPMASLGIGCRTNYSGKEVEQKEPLFWLGRIDELAVFNRALSASDIERLAGNKEVSSNDAENVKQNSDSEGVLRREGDDKQ